MLLPFSDRARAWEPLAIELREIGAVDPHAKLDPWKLAPEVGLAVICDDSVLASLPLEIRVHLKGPAKRKWSGGVHPVPRRDGTLLCILNPLHSRRRNKVTLMEEIAHIYLDHTASGVQHISDGVRFRDYNQAQEQEAYGVGAAALLPWGKFFMAINSGRTAQEIAEDYDVTEDLVNYRIKITAASNLYRSRQKLHRRNDTA